MSTIDRKAASTLAKTIGLRSTETAVLKAIAFKLDNAAASRQVSVGYLMEACCKSRSVIYRALSRLRELGLLVSTNRGMAPSVQRIRLDWCQEGLEALAEQVKNFYLKVSKRHLKGLKTTPLTSQNDTQRPIKTCLNPLYNYTDDDENPAAPECTEAKEVDQGGGYTEPPKPEPVNIASQEDIEFMFSLFWAMYPRPKNKDGCRALFLTLFKPLSNIERGALFDEIDADLYRKQTPTFGAWADREIKFIPYPETYLHQRQWEDSPENDQRMTEFESMTGRKVA